MVDKIADGSKSVIRYVAETVAGTTPASPAMKIARFTDESLTTNYNSANSDEITTSRGISDSIPVSAERTGDINGHWSASTYDDWLTSGLQNTWSTAVNATGSWTFTRPSSVLIITMTSTTNITRGQFIKISGSTQPTQNGIFQVGAVTSTTAELVLKVGGDVSSVVLTAGGSAVNVKGKSIVNGTTPQSFTIEKEFRGIETNATHNNFFQYRGMEVDTFELNVAVDEIVNTTFSWMGRGSSNTTSSVKNTEVAATTTPVINAVNNVGALLENGVANALAQSFTMTANNNLRAQRAIGSYDAVGVGTGRFEVSGQLEVFFTGQDFEARIQNFTETAIVIQFNDSAGNYIIVSLPRVKLNNSQVQVGGNNEDVIAQIDYTALEDQYGVVMRIDTF